MNCFLRGGGWGWGIQIISGCLKSAPMELLVDFARSLVKVYLTALHFRLNVYTVISGL